MMDLPVEVPLLTRATLLASAMLTVMAGAIVAPVLPQFRDAFQAYPGAELLARLVLTLPALAIALVSPVSGLIVDRCGRRRLLLAGLTLYAIAGGSGWLFTNPYAILTGRAMLGIAISLVMTSSTTLISDYMVGPARVRFLGLQAAFMSLGGVVFLPLGGLLATIDWHTPFLIYGLAMPLLGLAAIVIGEPPRGGGPGAGGPGAADPANVPWLTVAGLYLIALVGMLAFYLGPTQVPFLMSERFGYGPERRGLAVAAMALAGGGVALLFSRLARRIALPGLLVLMFLGVGAGHALVAWATEPLPTWLGLVLAGAASGLLIPTLSTGLLKLAPPAMRGRLTGGLMSAIFWGQFLSPLAVQPLITRGGTAAAFAVVSVVMLGVGLLGLVLRGLVALRARRLLA